MFEELTASKEATKMVKLSILNYQIIMMILTFAQIQIQIVEGCRMPVQMSPGEWRKFFLNHTKFIFAKAKYNFYSSCWNFKHKKQKWGTALLHPLYRLQQTSRWMGHWKPAWFATHSISEAWQQIKYYQKWHSFSSFVTRTSSWSSLPIDNSMLRA